VSPAGAQADPIAAAAAGLRAVPPPGALVGDADDALMGRVAAGDGLAWRDIMDRHASAILGHAWYMLGDRAEAEDVVQETFVRLMAKARAWQSGGAKLRTWLYRVAINLCIDRRRARRTVPLDGIPEMPDPASDEGLRSRDIDRTRSVRRALAELPDRQRVALTLVHFEGLSNIEAAAALEVSVDALESLLARGRRTLRESLAADKDDLLGEA
jgi:RNA polymerase sigma-70 factor (ECF subfamily)